MRWFNPKKKQFQIIGTTPESGSIKVFKGEEQYHAATPSPNEKYIIYEKTERIDDAGTGFIKCRNHIDKARALIIDYKIDHSTEDIIFDFIEEWKKKDQK